MALKKPLAVSLSVALLWTSGRPAFAAEEETQVESPSSQELTGFAALTPDEQVQFALDLRSELGELSRDSARASADASLDPQNLSRSAIEPQHQAIALALKDPERFLPEISAALEKVSSQKYPDLGRAVAGELAGFVRDERSNSKLVEALAQTVAANRSQAPESFNALFDGLHAGKVIPASAQGQAALQSPNGTRAESHLKPYMAAGLSIQRAENLLRSGGYTRSLLLAPILTAMAERDENVGAGILEALLKDPELNVRMTAVEALGATYAIQTGRGETPDLKPLEASIKDSAMFVREAAVKALAVVSAAQVRRGESPDLTFFERPLEDFNQNVREVAVESFGSVYAAQVERGGNPDTGVLETLLEDADSKVRAAAVKALGAVAAVKAGREENPDLKLFEVRLQDDYGDVSEAAAEALGVVYVAQAQRGKNPNLKLLKAKIKPYDVDTSTRRAALRAVGAVYAVQAGRGEAPDLKILKAPLEGSDPEFRKAAVEALGMVFVVQARRGENPDIKLLQARLWDLALSVRRKAIEALGAVYAAQVERGAKPNLEWLQNALESVEPLIVEAALRARSEVYAAQVRQGTPFMRPQEWSRLQLWLSKNLPFEEKIVADYFQAQNPQAFIQDLERRAKALIENGFDPNNPEDVWLAFLGVRMAGINVDWDEFNIRIAELAKWDKSHPGSFKSLFSKGKDLPVLIVGSGEQRELDASKVNTDVLDRHVERLLSIKTNIDGLDWMAKEFPGVKAFSLNNLYYQLEKATALREGRIKPDGRFHVQFPAPEVMRERLLTDRKALYGLVFSLARERLGDKTLAPRLIALMRDLIVGDALNDEALRAELSSPDMERRVAAFQNFYGDYKNDLPASLELKAGSIKGLPQSFAELTKDLDAELAKVKVKTVKGKFEGYRLVPQGFLGVFRGRAGMTDCSFGANYGAPFTRAVHEDTAYYFVYKGAELKGYVGLQWAARRGEAGEAGPKVLAVDTVNAPSLDGEELLTDLFRQLQGVARKAGAAGVALPENVRDEHNSFNFENKFTIEKMGIYKKAKPVRLASAHSASWAEFTSAYGPDQYNSIESGQFKFLADIP